MSTLVGSHRASRDGPSTSVTDTKPVTIKDPSYTTPRDSAGIANVVSVGVLDVMPALYETNGHPLLRIPAAFAIAALLTYGYLGTLVSGAIGVWLGVRFAKRFPI